MPKKLSLQNAKKQVVEYMIYIITMVITVALLLSFNMINIFGGNSCYHK